ncbi:sterol desaturase family protein [Patulibacter minatonensis]|uniref:sterol desaturase family protein n=1 Tax=Patulibacter minatonensis TaxID=298163 RepID=UPI0006879BCC|nr:sterol desaturase family protein [Patulibacter minatonensis]
MNDPIIFAIPFFVLFMAVEVFTLRHAAHEHAEDPSTPVGYDTKDSATSIAMGFGSLGFKFVLKLGALVVFAAIYELSPLKMPMDTWWPWLLLLFAEDLSFYAYHRGHHRIRMLWATHVVHHSSQHYNLSTAVRQDWSPFTAPVFWVWLAVIGFPPWAILLAQSWNLLYQFLLHTEAVRKLPRPIELVMNTPSHHRVHHGVQDQYLDKNYGGIFIVWDRLFRTFEPEGERVVYGLTTNIDTHNPVRVAYHEWAALIGDVRRASSWRDRAGYLFHGPGWSPEVRAARDEDVAPGTGAAGAVGSTGRGAVVAAPAAAGAAQTVAASVADPAAPSTVGLAR